MGIKSKSKGTCKNLQVPFFTRMKAPTPPFLREVLLYDRRGGVSPPESEMLAHGQNGRSKPLPYRIFWGNRRTADGFF